MPRRIRWLRKEAASARLREHGIKVPRNFLKTLACFGAGPPYYLHPGGYSVYKASELDAWASSVKKFRSERALRMLTDEDV